ncbi:MAG: bifunctional nuclease family protein [Bacteroidales bacterium]|jgi:bifunctional DNase/RNase|nr:bifunctional nuclease family protein [Bacteroidales bacterium]
MDKIRLNVLGISVSQTQTGAYALVLGEENGPRRIPIIIGFVEAQSIGMIWEGIVPSRPFTHDLIKTIADAFGITITEVLINRLQKGIFYSELICQHGGTEIRVDSRTSDAVALAVRFGCPIYTTPAVLEKAGIVTETHPNEGEFSQFSLKDLTELLNEAVLNENYERASAIRDEINKRKTP